jgi:hypothetical protein
MIERSETAVLIPDPYSLIPAFYRRVFRVYRATSRSTLEEGINEMTRKISVPTIETNAIGPSTPHTTHGCFR